MRVPAHIFREYDVRGLVEEDLGADTVRAIGRGFATFLARKLGKSQPVIALGRDVRPSSDPLRARLVEGLVASGAKVLDTEVVPTPVLYFACHHLVTDGGVMITGSHNPPEYNGFKLGYRDLPLSGAEIQEVRKLIESDDFEDGDGSVDGMPATDAYCDMIASKVKVPRALRVVLDPANATGALFAGDLLERIGVEVDRLYDDVDGTFPNHHPDPTVDRHVADLRRRVVETKAELGIGLDGDCDRIGAVDETGRLVRGDQLAAIFARDQLRRTPGERILFDVKSSLALEEDIRAHGGVPVMWKTGHSLAKQKMFEDGIPFGGEMSGHLFFFHDYFGFDDAIYSSLRLVEILSETGTPMSELLAGRVLLAGVLRRVKNALPALAVASLHLAGDFLADGRASPAAAEAAEGLDGGAADVGSAVHDDGPVEGHVVDAFLETFEPQGVAVAADVGAAGDEEAEGGGQAAGLVGEEAGAVAAAVLAVGDELPEEEFLRLEVEDEEAGLGGGDGVVDDGQELAARNEAKRRSRCGQKSWARRGR